MMERFQALGRLGYNRFGCQGENFSDSSEFFTFSLQTSLTVQWVYSASLFRGQVGDACPNGKLDNIRSLVGS